MFFFIDESWQTVSGVKVGTLGCLAVPAAEYNRFCRSVYRIKQEELGAQELQEKELKGTTNFCKAAFKADAMLGVSPSLVAVNRMLHVLHESEASVIALATTPPVELSIRHKDSSLLTQPYVDLVFRMSSLMRDHRDKRGLLFFDQVGHKEDQRAACAVQNFFVRTHYSYSFSKRFVQVPHFTHSSVSPGLQVADLIAYLCAHTVDAFATRPELRPWWDDFAALSFTSELKGEARSSVAPFEGSETVTEAADIEAASIYGDEESLEGPPLPDMKETGEP